MNPDDSRSVRNVPGWLRIGSEPIKTLGMTITGSRDYGEFSSLDRTIFLGFSQRSVGSVRWAEFRWG